MNGKRAFCWKAIKTKGYVCRLSIFTIIMNNKLDIETGPGTGKAKWIFKWTEIRKEKLRPILKYISASVIYISFVPALLFLSPFLSERFLPAVKPARTVIEDEAAGKRLKALQTDIRNLERRIERLTPGNAYLVVNTTENRFALYRNRQLIREGMCSTGSMISLEGEGDQRWFFRTPRGDFRVQAKLENPIWRRPDWAFIEEGLPVPPGDHHSRYERGVLGDYALTLGDGYMIHGTLYQRFIGLPVTHGCIRMLDEDLEAVFQTLPAGAKVFIY
jgi:lipoprotein-anchoring transpeptidase ErfK/SrfK